MWENVIQQNNKITSSVVKLLFIQTEDELKYLELKKKTSFLQGKK